jgi:hypothetical protein
MAEAGRRKPLANQTLCNELTGMIVLWSFGSALWPKARPLAYASAHPVFSGVLSRSHLRFAVLTLSGCITESALCSCCLVYSTPIQHAMRLPRQKPARAPVAHARTRRSRSNSTAEVILDAGRLYQEPRDSTGSNAGCRCVGEGPASALSQAHDSTSRHGTCLEIQSVAALQVIS